MYRLAVDLDLDCKVNYYNVDVVVISFPLHSQLGFITYESLDYSLDFFHQLVIL